MLLVGLASVAAALLILTLAVLPATEQVPLARLDPATAPPTSALAGAGVAAGAQARPAARAVRGRAPGSHAPSVGARAASGRELARVSRHGVARLLPRPAVASRRHEPETHSA